VEYLAKSDVVTAALRELLVSGEFAPGSELRQRELAERFNVSSTPVREALKRLESEGLVLYDVHRGARVIENDLHSGQESFLIRASLEGLASSLAAERITAAELAELVALNARLARHTDRGSETTELNRRLHFRLFESSRSPLLIGLLRLLWHSFPRRDGVRSISASVAHHKAIIDALSTRDTSSAEALTRHHILEGLEISPQILQCLSPGAAVKS